MGIAAALTGCYSPTAALDVPCGPNGECPSGQLCNAANRCTPDGLGGGSDVDAASTPDIDAPMQQIDAANTTCACSGNDLVCGTQMTTCSDGCSSNGTPHCFTFAPVNGVSWTTTATTSAVSWNTTLAIDGNTGAIMDGSTSVRTAGTGVRDGVYYAIVGNYALFAMAGLSTNQNTDIRITGTRPVILLVDGDVTIRGVIDVSGGCANGTKSCAGPGGGAGGIGATAAGGCGAGGPGADGATAGAHAFGGGGAGFGTAGAVGGGVVGTSAGTAGAQCGTASLVPLLGGSGGGRGGNTMGLADHGEGGGGGGAIQITASGSITVSGQGVIDAGGAGGEKDTGTTAGAGGGGSGGAILLQATSVTVSAILAANGGGGGAHNPAADGSDGTRTTTPALGGNGAAASSYNGGNGGAGTTAPTVGGPSHGGGGGGAVGYIRIQANARDLAAGTISPPPSEASL